MDDDRSTHFSIEQGHETEKNSDERGSLLRGVVADSLPSAAISPPTLLSSYSLRSARGSCCWRKVARVCSCCKSSRLARVACSAVVHKAGLVLVVGACFTFAMIIAVSVLQISHTTSTLADFLTYVPHDTEERLSHSEKGWFNVEYGPVKAQGAMTEVYFFQIPEEYMNRIFLLTALISRGDGHASVSHTQPSELPIAMFFNLTEDRSSILLYKKQTAVRASNYQDRALLYNGVSDMLVASLEVVKDKEQSVTGLAGPLLEENFKIKIDGADESFDSGDLRPSRVLSIRAFPRNVNFVLEVSNKHHTIQITYCLALLPDEPMKPRFADPRIGYFSTAYLDIGVHRRNASSDTNDLYNAQVKEISALEIDQKVRIINRWRLEKDTRTCDETKTLCDPIKPIIFYIDPTVPKMWRNAVKRGIELWQPAFEALGFRNVPRVALPGSPEWPDDYDPADIRYASVGFSISEDYVFSVGPSIADPYTGEILDADIAFSEEWVRTFAGEVAMEESLSADGKLVACEVDRSCYAHNRKQDFRSLQSHRSCQRKRLRGHEFTKGDLIAKMRLLSTMNPDGRVPISIIEDGLAGVTVHEIGHTLGLRHNFKGSASIPHEKIYDGSYTRVHSSSSSVMDYVGAVIPPNEELSEQNTVFPDGHAIGAYDILAIKYGYAIIEGESADRQRQHANAIAKELSAKGIYFGTDDDTDVEIDPLARRYDLTDDPVAYARDQMKVADNMRKNSSLKNYQSWNPGYGFTPSHIMYRSALKIAKHAASNALYHVGGRVISHKFPGDTAVGQLRSPVTPVTAAYQRQALNVVTTFLATPIYHNPSDLQVLDQQVSYFALAEMEYGLNVPDMRGEFDSAVKKAVFSNLLNTEKLTRIHTTQQATLRGSPVWSPKYGITRQDKILDSIGIYDVMQIVTNAVWCQWEFSRFRQPHEWPLILAWTSGLIRLQNRTSPLLDVSSETYNFQQKTYPHIHTALARLRHDIQAKLSNSTSGIDFTSDPALHAFLEAMKELLACKVNAEQQFCL